MAGQVWIEDESHPVRRKADEHGRGARFGQAVAVVRFGHFRTMTASSLSDEVGARTSRDVCQRNSMAFNLSATIRRTLSGRGRIGRGSSARQMPRTSAIA